MISQAAESAFREEAETGPSVLSQPKDRAKGVMSLSFHSFSLNLSCFLEPLASPVSNLFPCPARPPPLTAFTISGVAVQLRKCCETSDSTSCSNQYISGPADMHPQLRMHTCPPTPPTHTSTHTWCDFTLYACKRSFYSGLGVLHSTQSGAVSCQYPDESSEWRGVS